MKSKGFDPETLFKRQPGMYLVLRPDFTIEDASDAYLRATLTWRDEIRGARMFDVFPDNPDDPGAEGVRHLRASLEQASQVGVPDVMGIQKYDVRDQVSRSRAWVEKHWSVVNTPVFWPDSGELRYVIHHVEDVTNLVLMRSRVEELLVVNAEEQASVQRMLHELQERERALRIAEADLDRAIRRVGRERLVDLEIPDEVRSSSLAYMNAGERAIVAGLYNAFHGPACRSRKQQRMILVTSGELLPPCEGCGAEIRYRLSMTFPGSG